MKKFIVVFLLSIMCVGFVGCSGNNESVVRIHIRANSNSECDQTVKLAVRDEVVNYITPLIASCNHSEDVKVVLEDSLKEIEEVAD